MGRAFAALLFLLVACDMPRDAGGTLERVRGGEMRVGFIENPPWIKDADGRITGVEARLVEGFARELGARIRWVRGSEAALVEALHRREIDLLATGLTSDTPHASRVGMTQPYLRVTIAIGHPPGRPPGDPRITVPEQRPDLAGRVRERGGEPVAPEAGVPSWVGPVEALVARGLRPDAELMSERHVMAVPGGESAFLLALDRYLHGVGEDGIRRMLAEELTP